MRATAILIGLALAVTQSSAQQPSPSVTFQVEVNYVDIDAIVTDAGGNFVSDLTKSDFQLLEDGRPQTIDTFALLDVELPGTAPRPRTAGPPDVRTNADPINGRLYVFVLDDLNVAPLRSRVVVDAARRLVERHFGDRDTAAIIYTSGRTDGAQEFTSDRAQLLAAIDKFQGRKLRSTVIEKMEHYFQQTLKEIEVNADEDDTQFPPKSGTVRGPNGYSNITTDPDDFERGHRAQQVLSTVKRIAEMMGGIRGRRKAIVMFSEGIDYPIYDVFGSQAATSVIGATRDAIAAAARSNVSIFSVDPRGLVGMTSEAIELNYTADPTQGFDPKGLLADMYLSQDSLRTLAEETGGYAAVNVANVDTALSRIVRANSTYYVLGYHPASAADGRFHKIELRVNRPGVRVWARKGYVSPRPLTAAERASRERQNQRARGRTGAVETSDELRELLTRPLQQNGLTLAVQAAAFKTPSRDASVALAIELDSSRMTFAEQPNKTIADTVELSLFALDERGRQHAGNFAEFNLALRPETYARVRNSIIRMNPRIALRPGRYQLRVGVRERGAGEMGSVFYDLQVPDFDKDGLAMSGVLLADEASGAQFTAQPDTQLPAGALPFPATSRRTFSQGATLHSFTEIYDRASSVAQSINVNTALVAEDGTIAFSSRESLDGAANSRIAIPHTRSIPLRDVRPGRYALRIEARRGNTPPVLRETVITVTPSPGR